MVFTFLNGYIRISVKPLILPLGLQSQKYLLSGPVRKSLPTPSLD